MKAIIMAGGYATRLWPLTKERAKPLLMINGKPLITHIVEKVPEDMEVIISTNETFENDFRKWDEETSREISFEFEKTTGDKNKLGVLGAIAECIKNRHIDEDIMVIGGDNYFHFSLKDFIGEYEGKPLIAVYDIKDKDAAKRFGVLCVDGDDVTEFSEKPENPKSTLINTFCCIIPKENFKDLSEFVKTYADNQGAFITQLLKKGISVKAYVTDDSWYDIGSFEGYLEAHQEIKRDRKDGDFNFYGVDFVGKNTLEGKVFIDKGTIVKNSSLKDCIIFSDCLIENTIIENSIIDEKCRITKCEIGEDIIEKGSILDCRKDRCVVRRVKVE